MINDPVKSVNHVRKQLRELDKIVKTSDMERAHIFEDDLYRAVLFSIAEGIAEDPAAMAREVLKAQKRDHPRFSA